MCGRFVSSHQPDVIAQYFGASLDTEELPVNFNVAPTNEVYAVVEGADHVPALRAFHWGLVPTWAKDTKIASAMINARAETVASKPAFKSVFRKTRCIIPMDGFYEWKTTAEPIIGPKGKPIKQPVYIHRVDDEPLAVAGLWTAWRDREAGGDAGWLHTCSVITTEANATMVPVHHRMPVILPATRWAQWLDPNNDDLESLLALLVPAPDNLLTMHTVSTEVNNVRNKGAQLREETPPLTNANASSSGGASEPTLFGNG